MRSLYLPVLGLAFASSACATARPLVAAPAPLSPYDAVYEVAAPTAVPPPRDEVVPPPPTPAYVWIPGYWDWRGRFAWVEGRYVLPPEGRAQYVAQTWRRRDGLYWPIRGHWQYGLVASGPGPFASREGSGVWVAPHVVQPEAQPRVPYGQPYVVGGRPIWTQHSRFGNGHARGYRFRSSGIRFGYGRRW